MSNGFPTGAHIQIQRTALDILVYYIYSILFSYIYYIDTSKSSDLIPFARRPPVIFFLFWFRVLYEQYSLGTVVVCHCSSLVRFSIIFLFSCLCLSLSLSVSLCPRTNQNQKPTKPNNKRTNKTMKKWIQRRPTNVWLFVCLSSCVVMSLISFLFMGWQSMNIPSSTTKRFHAVSSLVMFQTTTTGEETTHHHHQTGRGGVGMDHDNDENENDHHHDHYNKKKKKKKKRNGLSPKAIQNWCPTAQCHVTDLCHPCQRRYLIIITTGRSGSTTIQKMLNELPGIRLSGENNGMLTNFQYAISATRDRKEWSHIGIQNPYSPWHHHSYPTSAFACIVQQMIEIINPPPNINGTIIHHHQKTTRTTSTTTNLLEEPTEQEDDDEDDDDEDTIIGFKTIRFPLDTSIMSGTKGIARGGGRQQQRRRQQQWKQNNRHNSNNTHHRDATAAAASSSFELQQQEQQLWLQSVAATMASQQQQQQQQQSSSSSDLLLYKTAQFLNETLPCAKFVINIRSDSSAHAKAIHKVWGNGYNLQHLVHASQQRTKELVQLANYLGAASSTTTTTSTTMSTLSSSSSRVAIMDSSKWMSNVSLINELISWLGYTTPACSFDRLFQYNTNNTKNGLYGRGQYIHRDKNPIDCHALSAE